MTRRIHRMELQDIAGVRVLDSRLEPGKSFWNEHTYYEVAVCTAGNGYYKTRRGRIRFKKASVVICNQYEPHAWQSNDSAHIRYVQLNRPLGAQIFPFFSEARATLLLDTFVHDERGGYTAHDASPSAFVVLARMVDALADECRTKRPYAEGYISAHVIELLSIIGRDIEASGYRSARTLPEPIERSLTFIHGHLAEDITLAAAAETASLSPDYFSKLFQRETNFYFTEYVNEMRIREACRLLRGTAKQITDIAFASGYRNIPYFNRIFKSTTGFTPAQYRRKAGVLVRADRRGKREEKRGKE